jgi:hypothetical protein
MIGNTTSRIFSVIRTDDLNEQDIESFVNRDHAVIYHRERVDSSCKLMKIEDKSITESNGILSWTSNDNNNCTIELYPTILNH